MSKHVRKMCRVLTSSQRNFSSFWICRVELVFVNCTHFAVYLLGQTKLRKKKTICTSSPFSFSFSLEKVKIIWWLVINILRSAAMTEYKSKKKTLCICSFYANSTVHMIQSHAEFLLFIVLVAVFFSGKQKRQARFRQLKPDLKGVLDFHVDR